MGETQNLADPRLDLPIQENGDIYQEEIEYPHQAKENALDSITSGDIKTAVKYFRKWSDYPVYILLKLQNAYLTFYTLVLSAKRGNSTYTKRIRRKFLKTINRIPEKTYFDYKDRSKIHQTNSLFLTLTYSRQDLTLSEAWIKVSYDLNLFLANIRKQYGKIKVARVFEAHKDGFVHIHLVVTTKHQFNAFWNTSKDPSQSSWRIQEYQDIKQYWTHGFSDIRAVDNLHYSMHYLMKYIIKSTKDDTSLALNWAFNKRQYSISKNYLDLMPSETNSNLNRKFPSNQLTLEGKYLFKCEVLGFYQGILYPNSSNDISETEAISIQRSPTYLSLENLRSIQEWKKEHGSK